MQRTPVPLRLIAVLLSSLLSPGIRAADAPRAGDDVATLLVQIQAGSIEERCRAMAALTESGPAALPAVPALQAALRDPEPQIRATAATALGRLALAPDTTLPALVELWREESPPEQPKVGLAAALAVARFGPAAMPHVLVALRHEQPQVVRCAAAAAFEIGPAAQAAVPLLLDRLPASDDLTRRFLINALIGIGPPARAAVPALTELLTHEDFHTQYWACRALGAIGPAAGPAVPALIQRLQTGNTSVRRNAAAALGQIGPTVGEPAAAALIAALADRTAPVREQAVIALGRLGPPLASPAVPAIEQALADGSRFGALSEAAKALWLLRPDSPTPRRILLRQLDGDDEPWVAARILGEIGPQLDAVDAVIQRLRAEKAETRQFAAQALGDMNPQAAAPAQPELERLLNDPEQDVRHAAESALQRLRAPARTE